MSAGALIAGVTLVAQQGLALLPSSAMLPPMVAEYSGILLTALLGTGVYLMAAVGLKVSEVQYLQERLLGLLRKVTEKSTRLVLHSAADLESLRERARAVGADGWIQKNFDSGRLATELRRLMLS